jgi:hypothetical protein
VKRLWRDPRPLYLFAVAGGATVGGLVAVDPPGLQGCPPAHEGQVLCVFTGVWLRGLTAIALGLLAGHIVGDLLAYRLRRLRHRWAAGDRLRFQTPAAARHAARGTAVMSTDPALNAACWGMAGSRGPQQRAAQLGWLLAQARAARRRSSATASQPPPGSEPVSGPDGMRTGRFDRSHPAGRFAPAQARERSAAPGVAKREVGPGALKAP